MTADEARELTNGSMKHKGFLYKLRLAWICGRINQRIEYAAEHGRSSIRIKFGDSNTAKYYYPLIKQCYEQLGFDVHRGEYDSYDQCNISWKQRRKNG